MHISTALCALLASLPSAYTWGTLGHETIAWIAQSSISDSTTSFVQTALNSKKADFMANVSTWADSYRHTSGGSWSAPLHYIDANDSPPDTCGVEYDRDCADGRCVVSAIVNYTQILVGRQETKAVMKDAMRFLIHFVGDIHQPLHDEAVDKGGNGINITWNGRATNLHHIWDTEIPEKLAGGQSAKIWSNTLLSRISAGDFQDSGSWNSGISLNDTLSTALSWATDANAFVCSDVLLGGIQAVEEGELSGSYYDAHKDVAQEQIAKAGVRLGALLDLIAGTA